MARRLRVALDHGRRCRTLSGGARNAAFLCSTIGLPFTCGGTASRHGRDCGILTRSMAWYLIRQLHAREATRNRTAYQAVLQGSATDQPADSARHLGFADESGPS